MSVSFPKPLTEKEEKFYIKQYEQGDLQARHILIEPMYSPIPEHSSMFRYKTF